MTVAIVIAAGEGERWGNYLGVPKHLVEIDGERLIARTVRLAREHGASRVLVVAPDDPRYDVPGGERISPDKAAAKYGAGGVKKFLDSRSRWARAGRTVLIYGDCYFTDKAMATIMADRREWTLYCRPGASKHTGATAGECWAVAFYPESKDEYVAALTRVHALWADGKLKRAGGWETYRAMCGVTDDRLSRHHMYDRYVVIDDRTEDFDYPRDYDRWMGVPPVVAPASIVVPWRPSPDREPLWEWLSARWRRLFPSWELVESSAPDGPWCKGAAVTAGVARASHEIVVVADADVWCDGVAQAVAAVHNGAPWAIPHYQVCRLTKPATAHVMASGEWPGRGTMTRTPSGPVPTYAQRPYPGRPGGGMVVLRRETYAQVPIDPRFRGWGQEDESWALALGALVGRVWRGTADLWHLWHTPAQRQSRQVGSQDSLRLYRRYGMAARDAKKMAAIVDEYRVAA